MRRLLILLLKIGATALSIWVAVLLLDDITLGDGPWIGQVGTLLLVAIIFGLVNALVKPIVKSVGCMFYVLTLGLLALVVNGLLLLLTSYIADQLDLAFRVNGFVAGFLGALIISLVNWGLNLVIPDKKGKNGKRK